MKKIVFILIAICLLLSCSCSSTHGSITNSEGLVDVDAASFSGKKTMTVVFERETVITLSAFTASGTVSLKVVDGDGNVALEGNYDVDWNKYRTTSFTVPKGKTVISVSCSNYCGRATLSWSVE